MTNPTKVTEEQLTKLECDAHGFHKASMFVADYILQESLAPMSTAHNSMTTVMLTNFGMAFELKLKALYVKTNYPFPKTHSIADLFRGLPENVKSELESTFVALPEFQFAAFKFASVQPDPPPSDPIEDFQDFLAYLDEIGLYGRRYSFETYSSHQWWIEIEPRSLFALLDRITRFSNGLA